MQPQQTADGFKLRYRHFHPQSTVWIQNPFDHDVIFQVADERNNPYQYKLRAHKVSELPGGAVATLGVKAIVDELIQNTKEDVLRIWDEDVRTKHEEGVILRVKEAAIRPNVAGPVGEIDLSVQDEEVTEDEAVDQVVEEEEFPTLKNDVSKQEVANIASASLAGKKDAVIESD